MVTLRSVATAVASAALFAHSTLGFSLKRNHLNYVTTVGDAVLGSPARRVHSHSNFDLTFTLHNGGQNVRLALEPNHDLMQEGLTVSYLNDDGTVSEPESIDRQSHRVYRGNAYIERHGPGQWSQAGWARITVHRDGDSPIFDGAFRIDGDNHHIQTGRNYHVLKHESDPDLNTKDRNDNVMVVWRDSDIVRSDPSQGELKRDIADQDGTCNAHSLNFNTMYDAQKKSSGSSFASLDVRSLFGRQSIDDGGQGKGGAAVNLLDNIGSTEGCPTTRKVALVGIATDCSYWKDFDTKEDIQKSVISMVNKASEVYESTFKISLGLRNITISKKECPGTPPSGAPWNVPCGKGVDIADRLSLFSGWRGQFKDKNAYWTLLTQCNTDKDGNQDSAVGLAWRGQLCREGSAANNDGSGKNETIAGANVVVKTPTEWQIFAHESGHTFGAVHDCTSTTCPVDPEKELCCQLSKDSCNAQGKFIMNPSTGDGITKFSKCTIGNICSGLKADIDGSCLSDNKNVETISGNQCGNGIVEKGEECDCGGEEGCKDNKCCDPKTCKFSSGSVCDPTNEDCCSDQCKFAASSVTCRKSTGECDPEEKCPGDAASCPEDKHKEDGDSCGDDLQCASGQCTSRDLQCKVMIGSQFNTNHTRGCQSEKSSCLLTCQAPESGENQCIQYNQNFLDGTDCGAGGHCENGSCKGSSTAKEVGQWFHDHKNIAIPVGAALGGILALAILSCIFKRVRRRIRQRKMPKRSQLNSSSSWPSMRGGQAPNQEQWQLDHWQNDQWQQSQWTQPPPAPPYPQPGYPHPNQQGRFNRTGSMRYA